MNTARNLIIFTPGPKYNLDYTFRARCDLLSEKFSGIFFTSGPEAKSLKYSNFKVRCFKDIHGKSLITYILMLVHSIKFAMAERKSGNPVQLVVSYDPLKTGLLSLIVGKIIGCKVIIEVNGCYDNDWIYADIQNKLLRSIKRNIFVGLERFVVKKSDGLKLLFESQVDGFKPLTAKMASFPDYVDASAYKNIENKNEILFVGFPLLIKGVDILINAFKAISPDYPDWTLKILGFYPDKTELFELIGDCKNIVIHEPVDPAAMPDHIGRCGVFVLPSRTEAMGRVLIEAMAAGKPRVGTRVGGIPTVINDGYDGILIEPQNQNALEAVLKRLMSDQKLREELGNHSFRSYNEHFLLSMYLDKTVSFYEEVLAN